VDHASVRSHRIRLSAAVLGTVAVLIACGSPHHASTAGTSAAGAASAGSSTSSESAGPSSPGTSPAVGDPATSGPASSVPTVPVANAHQVSSPPPAAVAASGPGASIAGCSLFPADNAWRRNVSADPVDPHSAAWVSSIGASTHLHPDFGSDPSYGIPYVVVPANQATAPITFTAYGDQSDPGPYPVPLNAPVEAGGDGHVLVASANCHLYELYNAKRTGAGWSADSGAVFNLNSDALRPDGWTSADAAGLPILPGLVRRDEVASGHINHALRFTVSKSQNGFIHPATHAAGSTSDPNVPPMGARFRLKSSFDLSGYHGEALVILQALKTYGMIVADNGSSWYLSGATDSGWSDDDLNQLKAVPGSAFEAVSSGPVLH
jgi:hypothetical protein